MQLLSLRTRRAASNGRRSSKFRDRRNHQGRALICGKNGHYARDCRSSRVLRDTAHDRSNVALNTSEVLTSDSWVIDSGASSHVCKYRYPFEEYYEVSARASSQARRATRSSRYCELEWSGWVFGLAEAGLMLATRIRFTFKI